MPRQKKIAQLSSQTLELAQAAPQVINMRLGQFAQAGLTPKPQDMAEFNRMFAEKQQAFFHSWQAICTQAFYAQTKLANTYWQMMMTPWRWSHPSTTATLLNQWQDAVLQTANAGLAPVRRKASANVKRLSAQKRRSK